MSISNRFETETLARQRQTEIENQLRRSAELGHRRTGRSFAGMKGNFRVAVIIAATVGLSLLLATGATFSMAFVLALVR